MGIRLSRSGPILISVSLLIAGFGSAQAAALPAADSQIAKNKAPVSTAVSPQRQSKAISRLSQSAAETRAQQVSAVTYALRMHLDAAEPEFTGEVEVGFLFQDAGAELRFDFTEGTVEGIERGGKTLTFRYDGTAIYIPSTELAVGARNELKIHFCHSYSKDGNGLYRFTDPLDQQTYVYTHFEPYSANRMFPCFDQPDLKATFQLEVVAPSTWTVVSAVRETRVESQASARRWIFPPSLRFSTYLISLHAGPYRVWEDKTFRYPLRLLARQSMAAYVPVDEWFAITRHGFDFFDGYFAAPYPFAKYDQVAVPDFNAGAMENVAAVTFSERFLVRGQRSQSQKEGLAHTVLHEMAHMWFGDLVTMQWWNDLWLNESFATYASTLALAQHPDFPETWVAQTRSKIGAYMADEAVTTHPIAGEVAHTDVALSNFDAITYGKGAAFLRLLHYTLGEESFRQGLRIYFQRHAFQNTQLKDFMAAMESASQRPLQAMSDQWLKTAGVNSLRVTARCDAEQKQLLGLTILQSADPAFPTLREHKAQFGLYRRSADRSGFEHLASVPIDYAGAETLWQAKAPLACPELIFPNEEDFDYARVDLDPETLRLAAENLSKLDSPSLRLMVWSQMSKEVEDARRSLADFNHFIAEELPREKNPQVLRTIDGLVNRSVLTYLVYVPDAPLKEKMIKELSDAYQDLLANPEARLDVKLSSFSSYIDLLTLGKKAAVLNDILKGKQVFAGLTIDQDRRWELLKALSELGEPTAPARLAAEQKKDPSSLGRRQYLGGLARFPDAKRKQAMMAPIEAQKSDLAAADRVAIISQLFPGNQQAMRARYADRYAQIVPQVVAGLESGVARSYVLSLLPLGCEEKPSPLLERWLKADFSPSLQQGLLAARESNERCVKIMRLLSSKSPALRQG